MARVPDQDIIIISNQHRTIAIIHGMSAHMINGLLKITVPNVRYKEALEHLCGCWNCPCHQWDTVLLDGQYKDMTLLKVISRHEVHLFVFEGG